MSDATRRLTVLLAGERIGVLEQTAGETSLTYDDAWRQRRDAYPLSLSLPFAVPRHTGPVVDAYLWGLLPDNEQVLAGWAQRFHVSPRNPFALLEHFGEDCSGAVQFVQPDRALPLDTDSQVDWIDETEVATRLRTLRQDPSATRTVDDAGSFSLAGAQRKIALLLFEGRWGVPSGGIPTTHILKPPWGPYEGIAENEHFCLTLATAAGLSAAASEVRRLDDETAIVVTRFDRTVDPDAPHGPDALRRIHQEDLCQALGVDPRFKYQNQGGPSPRDVIQVLRDHSSRPAADVRRFVDALAFNWVIAGTDAHAKNYAVLHDHGGEVRLAPLYDVISALPYPLQFSPQKMKLAMRIGSKYRVRYVHARHWEALARENRLNPDELVQGIHALASSIPDLASDVCGELAGNGITHPIVPQLAQTIADHARTCVDRLSTVS